MPDDYVRKRSIAHIGRGGFHTNTDQSREKRQTMGFHWDNPLDFESIAGL
jgi:hypothetical protein